MSRNIKLSLFASALAVALSIAAPAAAQVPAGVAGGSYNSYGRLKDPSTNKSRCSILDHDHPCAFSGFNATRAVPRPSAHP